MDKEKIVAGVNEVFFRLFGVTVNEGDNLFAGDIAGWDSLNHVVLIRELETRFGLRFDLFEALELTGTAAIIQFIDLKINSDDHS